MSPFDFTGKHVLVTGASHGIGFGIASAFARAGAELTILSSTEDIHKSARSIEGETGRPVRSRVCDIADRAAVRAAFADCGPLDVLINNAGLELITPMLEPGDQVEDTFVRIIGINVIGTYFVTRAALPHLQSGASIVLTSSIWGKTGAADFAAYVTSKHATIGFMRTLAKELGPRGIRANAVCPGWVRTRAAMRSLTEVSGRAGITEDEMLDQILSGQALPGLMEPEDVASLYLFLASDHARSVTGQAYNVDRGEVMV